MCLVVFGLHDSGLTGHLTRPPEFFGPYGVVATSLGTGFAAAVLSTVANNMPTVTIGAFSIEASGATGSVREAMVHASVVSSDLGPKMPPIRIFATLLHVLQTKGVKINWGRYFGVGMRVTLIALTECLLLVG